MKDRSRKVIQCDLEGNEIRVFDSAAQAATSYGSKWATSIHKAIKYGLVFYSSRWKYEGEELVELLKATPGLRRKVVAVNLATKEETVFPSMSEASRQLSLGLTSIESSLQTGGKAKGYTFYYEDVGPMPKERKIRTRNAIVALNDEGEIVREWKSAYDAAKELGVINAAVYRCLNKGNLNAKCKGYRLRYKNDYLSSKKAPI